MQLSIKKICLSLAMATLLMSAFTVVQAGTTYTEDEFLNKFSGKPQKVIAEKLGAPFKKELSVKPTGASTVLGQAGVEEKGSKRVTVEMWYYKNIVRYDPKHTYKETEITFVNDKVMNIAFFNNR
jgi:hypothetical protein